MTIPLSASQSSRLARGATAVWVPETVHAITIDGCQPVRYNADGKLERVPPPCRVGEVVGLSEPWCVALTVTRTGTPLAIITYRDDTDRECVVNADTLRWLETEIGPDWQSAVTMPSWAIRHRRLIRSLRLCRARDVTEEEARAMGYERSNLVPRWGWTFSATKPFLEEVADPEAWGWVVMLDLAATS